MSYAIAHQTLKHLESHLVRVREVKKVNNGIKSIYYPVDDSLLADLDSIRCLDLRPIKELKQGCLKLNDIIGKQKGVKLVAAAFSEQLEGIDPPPVQFAKFLIAQILPLKRKCAFKFCTLSIALIFTILMVAQLISSLVRIRSH